MTSHDLLATLAALAGVCRDGERRYRVWAQRAQADELRVLLLRRVDERAAAAAELQRQIDWLGGAGPAIDAVGAGRAMPLAQRRATPVSMPLPLLVLVPAAASAPALLRPACAAQPDGPADDGDIALLLECEAAEVQAIDAYWHALQMPLSRRMRLLLQNQYAAVKRSHRRALVMRYLALGRLDAVAAPAAGTARPVLPSTPALPRTPASAPRHAPSRPG